MPLDDDPLIDKEDIEGMATSMRRRSPIDHTCAASYPFNVDGGDVTDTPVPGANPIVVIVCWSLKMF